MTPLVCWVFQKREKKFFSPIKGHPKIAILRPLRPDIEGLIPEWVGEGFYVEKLAMVDEEKGCGRINGETRGSG